MRRPPAAAAGIAPRIAIVRLSALGDVVMASPLIHALKARYPRSHVTWLAQPEVVPLLAAHPELDQIITVPFAKWRQLGRERRWLSLLRELGALRRRLRAQQFDWVLDPQGLVKSGLLAWLTGAPRRIGVDSREGSRYLMTEVVTSGPDRSRISSEYLALATYLALPTADGFPMQVAVAPADRDWATAWRRQHGLDCQPYIVLLPFTTRPQKHWFAERWIDLAGRLTEAGWPCLILGGADDRAAAEQLTAGSETAAMYNLAGQTGIGQAVALLAQAAGAVGVDTGLTHVAIARGLPTVCLFGSTLPYRETGRALAQVIYHPRPCSPCRRKPTCNGAFDCMAAIEVGEVDRQLQRLLAARQA